MRKIVGVLGPAGSGKDTFVSVLTSFGFERISFADPLYKEVSEAYDVTVDFLQNRQYKETPVKRLALTHCKDADFVDVVLKFLGRSASLRKAIRNGTSKSVSKRRIKKALNQRLSARRVLQLWGTDYRRRGPKGNDSYWLNKAADVVLSKPSTDFAFSDCRFANEANFIEKAMKGALVRMERPGLKVKAATHVSEMELLNRPVFKTIVNDEGAVNNLVNAAESLILSLEK